MSKKDLLDRITRSPADRGARRVEAVAAPAAPVSVPLPAAASAADAVTTRVSSGIVRRRQSAPTASEPAAPESPVIRRRQSVDLYSEGSSVAPSGAPQPVGAFAEGSSSWRSGSVAASPVDTSAVSPSSGAAGDTDRPQGMSTTEGHAALPSREADRPAITSRSDQARSSVGMTSRGGGGEVSDGAPKTGVRRGGGEPSTLAPAAGGPAAGGGAAAQPSGAAERSERSAEGDPQRRREPAKAGPSFTAKPSDAAPAPEDRAVPERPRFEGLGRAVVMPPPGYDPTNPNSFRRRPASPPQSPAARPGQAQPAVGGYADPNAFARRRGPLGPAGGFEAPVPVDDSSRDRRAPRRGRSTGPVGADGGLGMRRRPRRKVLGQKASSPAPRASKRKIRIDGIISVGQLAHELGIKASVVIKGLMGMGRMSTVNELLDLDTAALIASEFEYEVENIGFQENNFLQHVAEDVEEVGLQDRPPVVTIMGHVDHGKTTLLDAIRSAKVAAGEAGGITQHIGAYQVESDGEKVTFIDTPGHAAFTAMRARGASVTDIVVLVVAADDGVQAQTEEAISHAKAAGVPIVVAVNKMDKPGVSADPIKHRLSDYGLQPEDWGGDTIFVPVSALKRQGIDELLEAILLQAEVLELRANPDRHADGIVIEARLERGRGAVATLLMQRGTLKRGDNVVLGSAWGRVRAMLDHTGRQLKEAGPSTPVEIFGLSEVPDVGDAFHVVKTEKDARTIAEHRASEKRDLALVQSGRRTAADLFAQAESTEKKTLNVVLKSDVGGSLEALKGALQQIQVAGTELRILHSAVGDISESDVNLVSANNGLLVGFGVRVDAMGRQAADRAGVEPELYDIIYAVIDRVTALMSGLLGPQYEEVRQGTVEVRVVFSITKVGKVAGCYVTDGKVARSHTLRLVRQGKMLWEGRVKTLKRFKDDVRDVATGYECGIALDGFDLIEEGDILETYTREEKKV